MASSDQDYNGEYEPPEDDSDNNNANNDDNDDNDNNDNDDNDDNDNNSDESKNDDDVPSEEEGTLTGYDKHLNKSERMELKTAMEHIVAVGNYNRHQDWRINTKWKKRKLTTATAYEHTDNNTEETKDDADNSTTKKKKARKTMKGNKDEVLDVHAEDLRLYGRNGIEPALWPAKTAVTLRERYVQDTEWEHEHGDQIHPCKFSAQVLAAKQPMPMPMSIPEPLPGAKKTTSAGAPTVGERFMDQGEFSISKKEAPRALLLKCWERAVHAASCVIVPEVTLPTVETQQQGATNTNADQSIGTPDDSLRYSAAAANEKCQNLQIIHSLPTTAPFTCPNCQIDCGTTEHLKQHYYGLENHRGCCWPQIESAERALLDRVLRADVKSQTQSILHLVLSKLKQPPAMQKGSKNPKEQKKIFDWQDVTQVLEESLAGSSKQRPCTVNSDNVLQQTLLVDLEKPPLLINERTMDAITARLNGRYAKVPK